MTEVLLFLILLTLLFGASKVLAVTKWGIILIVKAIVILGLLGILGYILISMQS